jgi:hypothetical protein
MTQNVLAGASACTVCTRGTFSTLYGAGLFVHTELVKVFPVLDLVKNLQVLHENCEVDLDKYF